MKLNYFLTLTLFIFIPFKLLGFTNDSIITVDKVQYKSININPSFVIGNEQGFSGRIEYENSNWGKLIFNTDLGIISNYVGGLIIDLGLGYGYPVIYSKSTAVFINGQLTFISNGITETDKSGPTGLIEVEFRKSWKHISLDIAPNYRRSYLHDWIDNKNEYYQKYRVV